MWPVFHFDSVSTVSTKKEKRDSTRQICLQRTVRGHCHLLLFVAKCEKKAHTHAVFMAHNENSSLNRSSHALGVKCDSLSICEQEIYVYAQAHYIYIYRNAYLPTLPNRKPIIDDRKNRGKNTECGMQPQYKIA